MQPGDMEPDNLNLWADAIAALQARGFKRINIPQSHSMTAIYLDGEPQNLDAAALDALEWLRFLDENYQFKNLDDKRRLIDAIRNLQKYLPDGEPEYQETVPVDPELPFEIISTIEVDTTRLQRQCVVCGVVIPDNNPGPLCNKPECASEWKMRHLHPSERIVEP